MGIKNKRLKDYINTHAPLKIRSRAKDCQVVDFEISNDGNTVNATVKGSSGISYKTAFSGLLHGKINSECSCPYDYGKVCKHQVALAIDTEAYFSLEDQNEENDIILRLPAKKCSKDASYNIPNTQIYGKSMDEVIKQNASSQLYNRYNYLDLKVGLKKQTDKCMDLLVDEDEYWGSSKVNLQITKKEDVFELLCSCKATNKNLCKHQVVALNILSYNTPSFFKPEAKVKEEKEAALRAYGFTLDDDAHKNYFDFKYVDRKLEAIPKKDGILKLHDNESTLEFSKNLLNAKRIVSSFLPSKITNQVPKKPKVFGLLFNPDGDGFGFTPVIGNADKTGTRYTSKIEKVDAETYIAKKALFSEKAQQITEHIFKLEHVEEADRDKLHKFQFQTVKTIIEAIDDTVVVGRFASYTRHITPRNIEPIVISKAHPKLSFQLKEETHFYLLKAYITLDGNKTALKKEQQFNDLFCVVKRGIYFFYKSLFEAKAFLHFNNTPEIRINKIDFDAYNASFIRPLSKQFDVKFLKQKHKTLKPKAAVFKKQLYCYEEDDIIVLQPMIEYDNNQYELFKGDYITLESKADTTIRIQRDAVLEQAFYNDIQDTHPLFEAQDEGFFYISVDNFVKNAWFLDAFESFKTNEIEVFGSEKLTKVKYNTNKPNITTNINSEIDWFDVSISIAFGDQQVNLRDIRKSIVNKDNFVKLKDGTIGILPEAWVDKYSGMFRSGDVKKDGIKVSKYQLSIIDDLYDELDITSEIAKNHKQIKERLDTFNAIDTVSKPRGLKATLRDYQKEGLNWLNFLEDYNFGGCLADDMGLGKTLQIISFLKHIKNTKKPKIATLVVLPTSLIFNWQEEVDKFAPSLKYYVHTGTNRSTNTEAFSDLDIVFTTYGIVMRDIQFLKDYTFNYCILDESQAIKNPNSKRYKAVKLIKANNRLVLTGTPIENNTFDLYAQMNFVNPGLLGTMANFKNEFSTPIDKNKDPEAAAVLRKIVNPFLMRRTKAQVAKELPEKTEQVLYCTMGKEQQKLYDAYKNKYRNYLLNKIDEDGLGKSKMYVLEGLTKLRQICDAPQLLSDQEKYTNDSVKIDELVKHVTEHSGNHKILVFSQFVKMLSLIKKAFDAENITYQYLDGQTKDRQEIVDNFQNDDSVRVFLISLKAGGTGLNLTAADYVYLVDPWWNPAVEAQAIDRCYRIGQTKNVMAYKMICKNTIEEKIIKYQDSKKQLSSDIIQTDESFVKNLSRESITDLFS